MKYSDNIKLRKAQKRVEVLKGFYKHLLVYCIVNVTLFILRGDVLQFFQDESADKNFIEWVDWNILIIPIFWGIGLLCHAVKAFQYKLKFIANWEKGQLEKFSKEL